MVDEHPHLAAKNVAWTPIELIDQQWEKLTAPRREKERLEAEQKAAETSRKAEIAARKEDLSYSDSRAQEICERIAVGELLINICEDDHMPSSRQINRWLREQPAFNMLYQSAINDRLSVFEEQVIQIADDMRHDFKTVYKLRQEKRVPDPDIVARARIRIEVRFRHLKAGRPQKWGEATTLTVKNADPFDTSNLSAEQLDAEIAAIENKGRIVRVA